MNDLQVTLDNNTATLTGVLDFNTVGAVEQRVADWLRSSRVVDCTVDLGGITYSNSAGVALLLGWLRVAIAAGRRMVIRNMPGDMGALVRVGGLEGVLPIPLEQPGSV